MKPKNIIKLFEGLQKNSIIKKLFLHQGQHVYINNVLSLNFTDMMNLWLSYEEEIIKPNSVYNDARILLTDLSSQNRIIEGTPIIKLSLKVGKPTAIVSVRLIDLGEDYRLLPN